MSCRYCHKAEDDCAVDHDEDVMDESSYRRAIQVRRPIAHVYPYTPPPREEKSREDQ